MYGNYFPMPVILQRVKVVEKWSYSVCIFLQAVILSLTSNSGCITEQKKEIMSLDSTKAVQMFLLGEGDSPSKIMQGYTLKNASADTKGFALKRKTIYCFSSTLSSKQCLLLNKNLLSVLYWGDIATYNILDYI